MRPEVNRLQVAVQVVVRSSSWTGGRDALLGGLLEGGMDSNYYDWAGRRM